MDAEEPTCVIVFRDGPLHGQRLEVPAATAGLPMHLYPYVVVDDEGQAVEVRSGTEGPPEGVRWLRYFAGGNVGLTRGDPHPFSWTADDFGSGGQTPDSHPS